VAAHRLANHLIFERDAFWVVRREPDLGGARIGEGLDVVA